MFFVSFLLVNPARNLRTYFFIKGALSLRPYLMTSMHSYSVMEYIKFLRVFWVIYTVAGLLSFNFRNISDRIFFATWLNYLFNPFDRFWVICSPQYSRLMLFSFSSLLIRVMKCAVYRRGRMFETLVFLMNCSSSSFFSFHFSSWSTWSTHCGV